MFSLSKKPIKSGFLSDILATYAKIIEFLNIAKIWPFSLLFDFLH